MSNRLKAHLAILVATVIFAVNYWVSKELIGVFSPLELVLIRTWGASLCFGIALLFMRTKERVNLRDLGYLALVGFFGVTLNQYLFFGGLQYTTAVEASTIHVSNPVITIILSTIFLHSRLSRVQTLGVFVGMVGALILVLYQKGLSFESQSLKGNLMIFGNTTAYAVFLIMVKPALKKYKPLTTSFWAYLISALSLLPFGIQPMIHLDWAAIGHQHALGIFYIVVAVTFLAYLLSIYSLKELSAPVVSFYIYLQPALAFLIAVLLGEQLLDPLKIVATFIIFIGVYLVNKKPKSSTSTGT